MSQTIEAAFRSALGVRRTARLKLTDRGVASEVALDAPCAVIGRGPQAGVRFESDTVSYRHAYLQMIGDRICCFDLFGPNTLRWDDGGAHPWASVQRGMRIGDGRLELLDDGWSPGDASIPSPLDYKARDGLSRDYGLLPDVELRGMNAALEGQSWPVNRVITLVGRDERCRVTLADTGVSQAHCSLVLLPSGLWSVDLLGKGGTLVNGDPAGIAHLTEGTALQIGPYRFQVHYTSPPARLPPAKAERASFLTKLHKIFCVEWDGDTLIVTPQGRARDFRYQDIQVEANAIITILRTHGFRNVLIDFSQVRLSGSLVVDSITQFCRVASGQAVICHCSPEQLAALKDLNLISLWPCHPTRAEALRAIRTAAAGAPQPAEG
jgi:pSer/pThr/pTyr-binding forkhead associated (FHA) protein/anti-anti-sigma regulatory factor